MTNTLKVLEGMSGDISRAARMLRTETVKLTPKKPYYAKLSDFKNLESYEEAVKKAAET